MRIVLGDLIEPDRAASGPGLGPARFCGVFMSVNPVFAALTGLIVLGQALTPADWLAIAVIVTVNAVSASGRAPQPEGRTSAASAPRTDPRVTPTVPGPRS
jgi:inner membrane transporter RhtA